MATVRWAIISNEDSSVGIEYDSITLRVLVLWAIGLRASNYKPLLARGPARFSVSIVNTNEVRVDVNAANLTLERDQEGALILPGASFGYSR